LKKACIVTGFFTVLRTFGAQVRAVLLDNVAAHWKVPRAELATEPSVVVHAKSGRRISYGEIVAFVELGNALLEPLSPPNGHLTTETLENSALRALLPEPAAPTPGSHATLRWREMDSNHRSLSRGEPVYIAEGELRGDRRAAKKS
jgi:hypothetical protein